MIKWPAERASKARLYSLAIYLRAQDWGSPVLGRFEGGQAEKALAP
jgi:hypothetical protein